MPGSGADGSVSYFTFTNIKQPFNYSIVKRGGVGGQPGVGGIAGPPGSGGQDLGGTQGTGYNAANYNLGQGSNGATGNNGNPGTNSNNPGQVYINVGPPVPPA
jgi:hypothetical protein